MENIYKCYSCETLLPESKMEGRSHLRKCRDLKACIKRKAKLIEIVVTEVPYRSRRDDIPPRGSRDN